MKALYSINEHIQSKKVSYRVGETILQLVY